MGGKGSKSITTTSSQDQPFSVKLSEELIVNLSGKLIALNHFNSWETWSETIVRCIVTLTYIHRINKIYILWYLYPFQFPSRHNSPIYINLPLTYPHLSSSPSPFRESSLALTTIDPFFARRDPCESKGGRSHHWRLEEAARCDEVSEWWVKRGAKWLAKVVGDLWSEVCCCHLPPSLVRELGLVRSGWVEVEGEGLWPACHALTYPLPSRSSALSLTALSPGTFLLPTCPAPRQTLR